MTTGHTEMQQCIEISMLATEICMTRRISGIAVTKNIIRSKVTPNIITGRKIEIAEGDKLITGLLKPFAVITLYGNGEWFLFFR